MKVNTVFFHISYLWKVQIFFPQTWKAEIKLTHTVLEVNSFSNIQTSCPQKTCGLSAALGLDSTHKRDHICCGPGEENTVHSSWGKFPQRTNFTILCHFYGIGEVTMNTL